MRLAAAAAVMGAGIWVGTLWPSIVEGDGVELTPGSVDDPVVTKSYVDEAIAKLGGGTAPTPAPGGGTGTGTDALALDVVELLSGEKLMVKAGGEVIVRVGKAVAYSSDTNGIADVTGGKDLKLGTTVPNNHLIWFPRDGRGVMPDPTGAAGITLIVRGEYEIK